MKRFSMVHLLSMCVILLTLVTSGIGLFYDSGTAPSEVVNQYGDVVRLYGKGLYAHDSYFKAPIFRGTDAVMFFLSCPLFILIIILDSRKKSPETQLAAASFLAVFMYYAANISFGVAYNFLHLVYISLFGVSFYGLIIAITRLDYFQFDAVLQRRLPYRGIVAFLFITGIALSAAWLPDIIGALISKRSLMNIEIYTTEVTYILDMGIISPLAFICVYLLKSRSPAGIMVLDIILTLCLVVGIMLPVQTIFQTSAGIDLPFPVLLTKVVSFCMLALSAAFFKWRLHNSFREPVAMKAKSKKTPDYFNKESPLC